MNAVLDTNILIDYLQGHRSAKRELSRYEHPAISLITWMEILVGAETEEEEHALRKFLSRLHLLQIEEDVAELAVSLRKTHRLRLPDAIIWSSAKSRNMILVTRNTRDFPADDPSIRVPYRLRS
jgi:hypothetical protein